MYMYIGLLGLGLFPNSDLTCSQDSAILSRRLVVERRRRFHARESKGEGNEPSGFMPQRLCRFHRLCRRMSTLSA
jgi:hypothetical protein